jgi:hypothetical protein
VEPGKLSKNPRPMVRKNPYANAYKNNVTILLVVLMAQYLLI